MFFLRPYLFFNLYYQMCHALVFLSQNAFRSIELDKYFASYSKWLHENKTLLQAAESAGI